MRHTERGYKLGKWLRRFRERQQKSQSEVARAAGLTSACLSQLENDKRVASATMLQRILAAMGNPSLSDFFYAVERGEEPVHRQQDRVPLFEADGPATAEYVGPRTRNFRFYLTEVALEPSYEKHTNDVVDNEKCVYVLEGSLQIVMDGETHEVGPGEACFIQAFSPHRMVNASGESVRFLMINVSTTAEPLVHEQKNRRS